MAIKILQPVLICLRHLTKGADWCLNMPASRQFTRNSTTAPVTTLQLFFCNCELVHTAANGSRPSDSRVPLNRLTEVEPPLKRSDDSDHPSVNILTCARMR